MIRVWCALAINAGLWGVSRESWASKNVYFGLTPTGSVILAKFLELLWLIPSSSSSTIGGMAPPQSRLQENQGVWMNGSDPSPLMPKLGRQHWCLNPSYLGSPLEASHCSKCHSLILQSFSVLHQTTFPGDTRIILQHIGSNLLKEELGHKLHKEKEQS